MLDLAAEIAKTDDDELEKLLQAVLRRYAQAFPEWEVSVISLEKEQNKNEQLDRVIAMLQKMKTSP